ncbi:MAG: hypothetical protein K2Q03_00775 [Sphingobacteriaceae bacterium]|nr:hypothetical protein [Sphingobacteriaceae bacterium]
MKKQSKITVKHYLEKKVKPQLVYSDSPLGHPLYYRITYKTKTTNLKSFTGAIMTEKAYKHFKETNTVLHRETNYKFTNINLKLENELFFIEKAIEEIVTKEESITVFDEYFIDNLKTFFKDLKESLYFQGWYKYKQRLDLMPKTKTKSKALTVKQLLKMKFEPTNEDIQLDKQFDKYKEKGVAQHWFYNIFNREESLIHSINILKEVTGFDATPYIHINTIKVWHVIDLITSVYQRTIFIDFLINYDIETIIKQNKGNKIVSNTEIESICNRLKNNHLGVYFKK